MTNPFESTGAPAIKFKQHGDGFDGIVETWDDTVPVTDIKTHEPQRWPDGNLKVQVVVVLQTDERDGPDDDGRRRLYAPKPSALFGAISDAIKASGGEFAPGGRLAGKYTHDGEAKPGLTAPKQYACKYAPPAAKVAAADREELF